MQTLTATNTVAPFGDVMIGSAGQPCESTCAVPFTSGTLVTLTGSTTWSGDCVGTVAPCIVDVDAPTNVLGSSPGAGAGPLFFGVNVTVSGPGHVIIGARQSCSHLSGLAGCQTSVQFRSQAVLTAVPTGGGAQLQSWGDGCRGSNPKCSLVVYQKLDIAATFAPRAK